jgi:transposase-like protein
MVGAVMDCPRCGSKEHKKDGFANGGKQRSQCKQCRYCYTVAKSSWMKPQETKELALKMYLEGIGFRGIGRVLHVSNTAVLGWIRKFGQAAERTVPETPVQTAELDELYTFVGKKRGTDGFGLALRDIIVDCVLFSAIAPKNALLFQVRGNANTINKIANHKTKYKK